MLSLAVALVVAAARPAPTLVEPIAPPVTSIASPGLRAVGVDSTLVASMMEHFDRQLTEHGIRVLSPREIRERVGSERFEMISSCVQNGLTCETEVVSGLSVQAVVTGSVVDTGSGYSISLRILSVPGATWLGTYWTQAESLEETGPFFEESARDFNAKRDVDIVRAESKQRRSIVPYVVGGILSSGAIAVGIWELALSRATAASLSSAVPFDAASSQLVKDRSTFQQTIGIITIVCGTLALAADLTSFLLTRPDTPVVSLAPVPGGGVMSLGGRF